MLLFFLVLSQIQLEPVEYDKVYRVESTPRGHILLAADGAHHWQVDGTLLQSFDFFITALLPLDNGGYIYSFVKESGEYGIKVVDANKRIKHDMPDFLTSWFVEGEGDTVYVSPEHWVPGKMIIPINVKGYPTMEGEPFYVREKVDPNLRGIYIVEKQNKILVADQMSPDITIIGKKTTRHTLGIRWRDYPGFLRDQSKHREWFKSFYRIVGFGAILKGYIVAVETEGNKTVLYKLDEHLQVVKRKTISGWGKRGECFSGTDGVRGWLFTPETLTVSVIGF